jgi:MbtH protein
MGEDTGSGPIELFRVVKNAEQQYAILPAQIANPPGWEDAGKTGSSADCEAFVREQWTDLRPARARSNGGAVSGGAAEE